MIRSVTLTVCLSCLLAGVLQGILPKGYYSKVINQLCVLYILLSAFTAAQNVPWHQIYAFLDSSCPQAQPMDFSADVTALLENEVENRAAGLLEEQGLEARARCEQDDSGSFRLILEPEPGQDAQSIEALFAEYWKEEGIPYQVQPAGEEP